MFPAAPRLAGLGPPPTDRFCLSILSLGFLLRVGLILLLGATGLEEGLLRQLDAETYDSIAWNLVRAWRGEATFDLFAATEHIQVGYYYFVAALYLLLGRAPTAVRVANALLGVGAAYLVYRIALRYAGRIGARLALLLACFYPSLLFWSTQNLKDPLVAFLLCGIVLALVRFSEGGRRVALGVALLAGLALSTLRTYLFVLAAASAVVALLWGDIGRHARPGRNWRLALAVLGCLIGVVLFYRSLGPLTWNYLANPSLESLQRIRGATAMGGSAIVGQTPLMEPGQLAASLPMGFAYALLAPWPFRGGSALYWMATPEMVLWYLVLLVAIAGGIALRRRGRRGTLFLVLVAVGLVATLGLFQSNMGTLLRQRAPAALLFFVLSGAGVSVAVGEGRGKPGGLKRGLDVVSAALGLGFCAPFLLLIAAAVRVTSGTPVLYVQDRIGRGGKLFGLLKFRTMRPGPDPDGTEYSAENDPRITAIGRLLRRYSLDELPQLWNVLQGDMSLVGPRPMRPALFEGANPLVAKRLQLRPGLTGWQQVNGRNSLTWEEILALDSWYVDHATLWLDLKILWRTVWVVLGGEGLYFRSGQAPPNRRTGIE